MRWLRLVIAIGALWCLAQLVGSAAAQTQSGISIVAPATVTIHPGAHNAPSTTVVTIRNDGPASTQPVQFRFVGDAPLSVATTTAPATIGAYDIKRFNLTVTPRKGVTKATGELIASVTGRSAGTVPLALTPSPTVPSWISPLIWASLVFATVLVFVAWLFGSAPGWAKRIGPVDWDFSKSWASNLTVFGALLGTILTAGALPEETTKATLATYAALNLLFGLGVLVGPFLYTALQRAVPVHKRSATVTEPQYQGWVWTFLLASVVVMWATVGELITIWQLFDEIRTGGSMSDIGLWAFRAVLIVGGIALVVLIFVRMRTILKAQTDEGEEAMALRRRVARRRLERLGVTNVPADIGQLRPERDHWTLY